MKKCSKLCRFFIWLFITIFMIHRMSIVWWWIKTYLMTWILNHPVNRVFTIRLSLSKDHWWLHALLHWLLILLAAFLVTIFNNIHVIIVYYVLILLFLTFIIRFTISICLSLFACIEVIVVFYCVLITYLVLLDHFALGYLFIFCVWSLC